MILTRRRALLGAAAFAAAPAILSVLSRSASALGCYLSAYSPLAGARRLYDPDGNVVSTVGSLTGGIQEGIALAIANKFPMRGLGGPDVVTCTAPIGNLAMSGPIADIDLGSIELHWPRGYANNAYILNSFNGGTGFKHSGRGLYFGVTNTPIYIYMGNNDPQYGRKIIQNTNFSFNEFTIRTPPSDGFCQKVCQIDMGYGDFIQNNMNFDLMSAWETSSINLVQWLLLITTPANAGPTGWGCNQNRFRIGQGYGWSLDGVMLGLGGDCNTLSNNHYDLNLNVQVGRPRSYVNTYGRNDFIEGGFTGYAGNPDYSIMYQAGAVQNKRLLRQQTSYFGVWDAPGNYQNVSLSGYD